MDNYVANKTDIVYSTLIIDIWMIMSLMHLIYYLKLIIPFTLILILNLSIDQIS